MKKPPNLNEEIAAMAKSDLAGPSELSTDNSRYRDEEKQSSSMTKSSSGDSKRKKLKCRAKLVKEIRISVSIIIERFYNFIWILAIFLSFISHYLKK